VHDSLDISPDPEAALRAIRIASIFSDLFLACNISQIYEFGYVSKLFVDEVVTLSLSKVIDLDCAFSSFAEFHDSRRRYYQHDFARYPMYDNSDSKKLFINIDFEGAPLVSSTTLGIESRLQSLTHEEAASSSPAIRPLERRRLIGAGKDIRQLFPARGLRLDDVRDAMALRRALTASYIEHYQAET
jgi:hypothetical protein